LGAGYNHLVWVLSRSTLEKFWKKHPDAKTSLKAWLSAMKGAQFASPNDLKRLFRTVDFVGNDRAIFNIGGNKYRLIVSVDYEMGRMFIRFIGTHAAYDKIDAEEV
jgi:mRNA interferase HigB